jgi:hypothetical protein
MEITIGIGISIGAALPPALPSAPVGISKRGLHCIPIATAVLSLWHYNALQCIKMRLRNFRHSVADFDFLLPDYSTASSSLLHSGFQAVAS